MEIYQGNYDDDVLDPPDYVAAVYNSNVGTLANWRSQKKGPPYIKIGAMVRYPRKKRKEWEQENTIHPPIQAHFEN